MSKMNGIDSKRQLSTPHNRVQSEPLDVIGVGFGPANLCLAVALSELLPTSSRIFLERLPEFSWHPGMMLEGSRMQISYPKDLVTMRDPTSSFSFLNYLHLHGNLESFLNLNELHPARAEYGRYLRWVADRCAAHVRYSCEAAAVRPSADGTLYEVEVRNCLDGNVETLRARNVVVAPGGVPAIPETVSGARVLHSSTFLPTFAEVMNLDRATGRVVVVGGGQSAGEIALQVLTNYQDAETHLVVTGYSPRPTDNSPFVNEQFHSQRSREFHRRDPRRRATELADLRNANYGAIEADLLDDLYRAAYRAKLHGRPGLQIHSYSRLLSAHPDDGGVSSPLTAVLEDRFAAARTEIACDALVLATGYERTLHPQIYSSVLPHVTRDEFGEIVLDEACRVHTTGDVTAGLFVQGLAEHAFGLGDTLLSLLPFRAKAIVDALAESAAGAPASPGRSVDHRSGSRAYPPPRHVDPDAEKAYAVMERFRFATLVSARAANEPVVTQVPLILDRSRGTHGVLFGHLDRANPHAELLDGRPITVLFHGPDSYIAPHVYNSDQLPTWNSITAEVHGTVRVLTATDDVVAGLCRIAERASPLTGCETLRADDPRIPGMVGEVVGFEVEIEQLVARFKLSQDRNDQDRRLAAVALAEAASADHREFIGYLTGFSLYSAVGTTRITEGNRS